MKKKRLISLLISCLLIFTGLSSFSGCKKDNTPDGDSTVNYFIDMDEVSKNETNEYQATYSDGEIYTIFQTATNYTPGEELSTGTVMVFCNDASGYSESKLNSWKKAGYTSLGFMTALGRDTASYYVSGKYDGETHYDIVQKDNTNKDVDHSAGTPYVVPTLGFCDYLINMMSLACERDYKYIFLEEPDYWAKSGYSEAFKNEWKDYYGSDWVDPESSLEAQYMAAELKAYIMTRAYEYIGTELKKVYPEVELIVCTHSSASYSHNTPIIANNYDILNSPAVDGLVAQAWSNTSNVTMTVAGVTGKMPFEFSYMEYSELINLAKSNGKKVFTLADPLADGVATEDQIRPIYEENIIAQFINPNIDSFEVMPWPSRAFVTVSGWYKALQENIIKISGELSSCSSTARTGSTGIGCLMSYTAAVNNTIAMPAFTSLCISLINRGVPVNVLTLEGLNDPNYLDGIHTLIVSYDHIKPLTSTYNNALAQWVKNGGSLIYVGGYNEHQEAELWWNKSGFDSPQAHLFSQLSLDVTADNMGTIVLSELKSQVESNYMTSETVNDTVAGIGYNFTSYNVNGAKTLYTLNNKPVVVEKAVEKGNVIIAGFEPSIINSGSATSYKLLENLVIRSMQVQNLQYHAPNYMHVTRGEYELAKCFAGTYSLDGLYLDIFSTQKGFIDMTVYSNPTLDAKTQKLYKKIDTESDTYIIQANGTYKNVTNTSSFFEFDITNTAFTAGNEPTNALIMLWTGEKEFSDVAITDENGKSITPSQCYTDDYGVLHIAYEYRYTQKTNVNVHIDW